MFCPQRWLLADQMPLFQGSRLGFEGVACAWISMVILLGW